MVTQTKIQQIFSENAIFKHIAAFHIETYIVLFIEISNFNKRNIVVKAKVKTRVLL